MWVAKIDYDASWEPVELQTLKQKLANLTNKGCKCLNNRPKYYMTPIPLCTHDIKSYMQLSDKDVQVGTQRAVLFDQYAQVDKDILHKDCTDGMYTITENVMCPRCYLTTNLLRICNSQRSTPLRIIKDEVSETNHQMFSCDKSTEKCVKEIDTTTSTTLKPIMKCSNVALYDCTSDSDGSWSQELKEPPERLKVKFVDDSITSQQQTSPTDMIESCICLERFIDSIRPSVYY